MKNIEEKGLKMVQGTFKIKEKNFITPRYLQLVLEGIEVSGLENAVVGGKVKIRPAGEEEKEEHKHKAGKKQHGNHFLVVEVNAENKTLTTEAITVTEEDTFFAKLSNEATETIKLRSKPQGLGKGRHHHRKGGEAHGEHAKRGQHKAEMMFSEEAGFQHRGGKKHHNHGGHHGRHRSF